MQESLFDLLGVDGIEMDPMAKVSIVRDVCEVTEQPAASLGWNCLCVLLFFYLVCVRRWRRFKLASPSANAVYGLGTRGLVVCVCVCVFVPVLLCIVRVALVVVCLFTWYRCFVALSCPISDFAREFFSSTKC